MQRIILAMVAAVGCICAQAAHTETITLSTRLVPGEPMQAVVITPDAAEQGLHFPTVYLLNGYSGDHNDWTKLIQPRLAELADAYGMVMVMPDGRDSWYWDSPAQPEMKMESFIITELVPYIDAHFPTIDNAKKRAITGLSMGGQGALYLAMRHPDVFANVGSTSGGVDIRPFPKNWKMPQWLGSQQANPKAWEEHSVVNIAKTLKPGQLSIIFDCGTDDFFAGVNVDLHQTLLDAGIPHDYISRPGNHSRPYWANAILYHLLFFSERFNK